MSSAESMQLVRRAIDLVNESTQRGEVVAELLAMADPDVHIDASRRIFNPAVYDGLQGMHDMLRDIGEAWEVFTNRAEQVLDAGGRIVSIETLRGRGRASKVEVDAKGAIIWSLRDGRIVEIVIYTDVQQALADAGLAP
jgi:ketosteroid isomerase-like protein